MAEKQNPAEPEAALVAKLEAVEAKLRNIEALRKRFAYCSLVVVLLE